VVGSCAASHQLRVLFQQALVGGAHCMSWHQVVSHNHCAVGFQGFWGLLSCQQRDWYDWQLPGGVRHQAHAAW
jgi:hypothetical protein